MVVDYRSDTVTKPGAEMLQAMYNAPLGDDVFGEDATVNELEATMAELFGMQAAVFCPSGTMTNQMAIKCHTQPGDEVICDVNSHIYQYEGGGIAFNSGASVKLIEGDFGRITAQQVTNALQPDDVHRANSSLVSLENTSNRGGGSCYNWSDILAIREVCTENGLAFHLDGARLFNALVATGQTTVQYGKVFDSISVCLSKSLGCPVGSILLGNKTFIKKARRIRKVFGGGMRQAGIIAAAGIYALKNNVNRLQVDHEHARLLENCLQQQPYVKMVLPVATNIVIFELNDSTPAPEIVAALQPKGILAYAIAPNRVRLVTHLDITPEMVTYTINVLHSLYS